MLATTSARVNSSPAFLSHLQDGIFYKYVVFKDPLSLLRIFFVAATLSAFSFLRGPGACSGLRSGAWPWKRNNGRLGAFN